MNLTFNHPEFEQEVRERLNIFDRELTVADARLVQNLHQDTLVLKYVL